MSVFLGNETISDLERRTGYVFSDEDRKWLESHRQDKADIEYNSDKFHIFDIPFAIHVAEPISDYLLKLLMKYEEAKPSKEPLQFAIVKETNEQREKRLKKEKEDKEWQDILANPNSIWNVKWHMLVPVLAKNIETGSTRNLLYWCFINTYTTGRDNIPDIIDGFANIELNDEGLHGVFKLYDNSNSDADEHIDDWNFVIGAGFYSERGNYIGNIKDVTFENTTFNLKEAINRYNDINNNYKEIQLASSNCI